MAIVKTTNGKKNIKSAIEYVKNLQKTDQNLVSGINCKTDTASDQMELTKTLFHKTDGRQYKHIIISFNPQENITPKQAHEIGLKVAEKQYPGYEILLATHIDKNHIHNHLIINSVNFETGKKLHQSKSDLNDLKKSVNEICINAGLKFNNEMKPTGNSINTETYRAVNGKKSYLLEIGTAVKEAIKKSINKNELEKNLELKGIKINWTDERKYIVFEDSLGHKVRDKKLKAVNVEVSKETLIKTFEKNRQSQIPQVPTSSEKDIKFLKEYTEKLQLKYNMSDFKIRDEHIKNKIKLGQTFGQTAADYAIREWKFFEQQRGDFQAAPVFDEMRKQEKQQEQKQAEIEAKKAEKKKEILTEKKSEPAKKRERSFGMGDW